MTTNTLFSFAQSLSTETGIDIDSATKVINWLVSEGVIDFPVMNETYHDTTFEANDNEQAVGATLSEGVRENV